MRGVAHKGSVEPKEPQRVAADVEQMSADLDRQVGIVHGAFGFIAQNALTANIWYGHRGQVLKMSSPGGPVSKATLDGASRVIVSYLKRRGGDSGWSDADA